MFHAKFFGALLLLFFAFFLEGRFWWFMGWAPHIVLTVLLVAALFFEFLELVLLALVAAWLINWQPGLPLELLYVCSLPLLAFAVARLLPWRRWLQSIVVVAGGNVLFVLARGSFTLGPLAAFNDFGSAIVFAVACYIFLSFLEGERTGERPLSSWRP